MKRTSRKQSEKTKEKIRVALKGKPKTTQHKEAISRGMENYWKTIPASTEDSSKEE